MDSITIGHIGLGGIGRPIAERLIDSGYKLVVCDLRNVLLEEFRSLGICTTDAPSACAAADVVIVLVSDDQQVKRALLGPKGVSRGVNPKKPPVVIVMSTVRPKTIREVADELRKLNVRVIDAPVSGGSVNARIGKLSIMAGGSEEDFGAVQPILSALGSNVFYCGPLGNGVATKIINNCIGITNLLVNMQMLRVADKLGIDLGWLARVMDVSSGRSFYSRDFEGTRAFFRFNTENMELLQSAVSLLRKDLCLGIELAADCDIDATTIRSMMTLANSLPDEQFYDSWKWIGTTKIASKA